MSNKLEYNKEPVYYCAHCLSLKILRYGTTDLSYCDNCGSTDILSSSIDDWEEQYQDRYDERFLTTK